MHMSDALLSPAVGLGFHAASAGLLATAARRAAREPGYERRLPLMGVLGAFVFAAQMVNFAIPGTGSSGHLGGGLLLAILLGPSAAFLVLASVLTVQALFFADGGLLALGCNVFNLGFWPCFVGIALHRRLTGGAAGGARATFAAIAAAVVSLELGALGVVAQTRLSGRADVPLAELALLVAGIHLPIAVVEGAVTAGVVRLASRIAPDRVGAAAPARVPALAAVLGAALFLGTAGASLASTRPDGLEWSLARALGPAAAPAPHASGLGALLARVQGRTAVFPEYAAPAAALDAAAAPGVAGALLTGAAVLALGAAAALARRRGRAAKKS
jgi:cobalt/nickel transport system permease protein